MRVEDFGFVCLKWIAVARIGLKLWENEATRPRIIFSTPDYSMIGSIRSAHKIASTRKKWNRENSAFGAKIASGTRNGSDLSFNCSRSSYPRSLLNPRSLVTLEAAVIFASAALDQVTQDRY